MPSKSGGSNLSPPSAVADEINPARGGSFANESDPGAVVLEPATVVERREVLGLDAVGKRPRGRRHVEADGHDRRSVLGDAGCPLLLKGLAQRRLGRHEEPWPPPGLSGEPLAPVADDLPVLVVVDPLADVPHASI